jgi:hypothetical protein
MRIFICWSGEQSKQVATAMDSWLPTIFGADSTFYSEKSIEKGTRWFEVVNLELNRATAGLVCVTLENVLAPWIHFEAGALAKAVDQKLFTYLHGLEPIDLDGPLSAYQYTRATEEDTKRLVKSLVESLDASDSHRVSWEARFQQHWPELERKLVAIEPLSVSKVVPELEAYFQRKTFNEPIHECATQSWIARYVGAVQTYERLKADRALLVRHRASYGLDLFDQLIAATDGYAMVMQGFLLQENKFLGLQQNGALDLPEGIRNACEQRRLRVKLLVSRLLAAGAAPIFESSRRFAKMATLEEKKNLLIHPAERAIRKKEDPYSRELVEQCEGSQWEFDRIVYYLAQERWEDLDQKALVRCADAEVEKVTSRAESGSLVPLYYALRAVRELAGRGHRDIVEQKDRIVRLIESIDKRVKDETIQRITDEIRRTLERPATAGTLTS